MILLLGNLAHEGFPFRRSETTTPALGGLADAISPDRIPTGSIESRGRANNYENC